MLVEHQRRIARAHPRLVTEGRDQGSVVFPDASLRFYLDAEVLGVARRKIYTKATGRLGSVDGPVAVTAAAVFVTVPLEHFVTHGRAEDVEAARSEARVLHSARMYEVNP